MTRSDLDAEPCTVIEPSYCLTCVLLPSHQDLWCCMRWHDVTAFVQLNDILISLLLLDLANMEELEAMYTYSRSRHNHYPKLATSTTMQALHKSSEPQPITCVSLTLSPLI